MKTLGVIPARYSSTRLPGKPLKKLNNKTLIQQVYENVLHCELIDKLVVATDDNRIQNTVNDFGGESLMTDPSHSSGTDRVAEVAEQYDYDYIANIQGDEPFILPEDIDRVIKNMYDNDTAMGSLGMTNINLEDYKDPNVVKVITDTNDCAIYFSRRQIPYMMNKDNLSAEDIPALKHIGLYVYQKQFLLKFNSMPVSNLEETEGLEQLRALEAGYKIHITKTEHDSPGIDTPEDLEKARRRIQKS